MMCCCSMHVSRRTQERQNIPQDPECLLLGLCAKHTAPGLRKCCLGHCSAKTLHVCSDAQRNRNAFWAHAPTLAAYYELRVKFYHCKFGIARRRARAPIIPACLQQPQLPVGQQGLQGSCWQVSRPMENTTIQASEASAGESVTEGVLQWLCNVFLDLW